MVCCHHREVSVVRNGRLIDDGIVSGSRFPPLPHTDVGRPRSQHVEPFLYDTITYFEARGAPFAFRRTTPERRARRDPPRTAVHSTRPQPRASESERNRRRARTARRFKKSRIHTVIKPNHQRSIDLAGGGRAARSAGETES